MRFCGLYQRGVEIEASYGCGGEVETEVNRDVAVVAANVEDVFLCEEGWGEGGKGEEAGVEDVGALMVARRGVAGCALVS